MKIYFDSAFDGRSWPVGLNEREATLGEVRVGRLGLLGILESLLGLRGPGVVDGVRIASLIPYITSTEGFWSRSAEVDSFGVARELIKLHDFFLLHGWQGRKGEGRVRDLALLTDHILPGVAHRLLAILSELDKYDDQLFSMVLLEPVDGMPLLWQQIFRKIEEKGGQISTDLEGSILKERNDLSKAGNEFFHPETDGSLQLIRPDGTLQASEEVAAWLAALAQSESLDNTVVIGADAVFDKALYRFGLPVTGAASDQGDGLLQILPLILACGWSPPDPARVMEMLTLPVSPIPTRIGRYLIKALEKWPAVGSPLWQEKLTQGLTTIEEKEQRQKVNDRLDIIFNSTVKEEYSLSEINSRLDLLIRWLQGRFQGEPIAFPALKQCKLFKAMTLATTQTTFSETFLLKLLDEATASVEIPPQLPAQAGLVAVATPEAITAKAKTVIWWNFTRDSVPVFSLPLLSPTERTSLTQQGVALPESSKLTTARAERWQRPIINAAKQLIMVCPRKNSRGEELHPHPLWDELLAKSEGEAEKLIQPKIRHNFSIPNVTPQKLPLPKPIEKWEIRPGSITPRETESPSSLEGFLGCPLKWCFDYQAKIRRAHWGSLPNTLPTLGSLAHELLEEVIQEQPLLSPEDGETKVLELFDTKAPQLVATIFQDGLEGELDNIRNTVGKATFSLLKHFHDAGVKKLTIEQHLQGSFDEQKLQGWADVVVEKPFTVIDLKRSYSGFFKKKMRSGTALQIVIYGWLLKEAKGMFPELAYFTLEDQAFLSTGSDSFVDAQKVAAPPNDKIWEAFVKTYRDAWETLKKGNVLCPGNGPMDVESKFTEECLLMEPPCRFCDYDVLCGRRVA